MPDSLRTGSEADLTISHCMTSSCVLPWMLHLYWDIGDMDNSGNGSASPAKLLSRIAQQCGKDSNRTYLAIEHCAASK